MPDIDTVLGWQGRTVVDRSGERMGRFEEIYVTKTIPVSREKLKVEREPVDDPPEGAA